MVLLSSFVFLQRSSGYETLFPCQVLKTVVYKKKQLKKSAMYAELKISEAQHGYAQFSFLYSN